MIPPESAGGRDRALVDRLARKDEGALREIGAMYGARLLAHAARITGDGGTAEEVVQDSLVAAWAAARSYRGEGSVLSWLLGIVRNQALNAVRRRRPAQASLEAVAEVRSPEPSPDARQEARERAEALRRALDGLSREHREALSLVFTQGLSLAEVAAVCRCPIGTVKSRLHHAKARLRSLLAEQGWEP